MRNTLGQMDKREERYHKRETGTRHVNDERTGEQRDREKGLVRNGEEIREAERKA